MFKTNKKKSRCKNKQPTNRKNPLSPHTPLVWNNGIPQKTDMDHVRRLLGHKSILNTQLYVNMEKVFFSESTEEYTVKVTSTIEESCKLIEVGFEFVTEMDGKKIFRKRK